MGDSGEEREREWGIVGKKGEIHLKGNHNGIQVMAAEKVNH